MTQPTMAGSWPARRARGQRRLRAVRALGGEPSGLVEPEEGRVGRLARGGILAGGLPEFGGRALDVEDVVDDLKRQAERFTVGVDRGQIGRGMRPP